MNQLYQAIIAIIVANFDSDYPVTTSTKFTGRPIFRGRQNNYVIPANGKYVIITDLIDENRILNPMSTWDLLNEVETYNTLLATDFQVDFYGDNSLDNSRKFQLLMNGNYANNYFLDNNYPCSVYKVKDIINMGDLVGRDMYLARYSIRFSLFNNQTVTTPLSTFDGVTNNIRLADVQTS